MNAYKYLRWQRKFSRLQVSLTETWRPQNEGRILARHVNLASGFHLPGEPEQHNTLTHADVAGHRTVHNCGALNDCTLTRVAATPYKVCTLYAGSGADVVQSYVIIICTGQARTDDSISATS